jgi:ATP-dependent exoDNAse (exonuclease V) beta subunit
VAAQIEAGTPPKEIMVLARQRNRLSPLADELRLLGIATAQPEKADLAEAPEVADLVACWTCWSRPRTTCRWRARSSRRCSAPAMPT